MKLYFRVIKYIKPHWRPVALGFFFTFTFVLFNGISVWVSADFVRELFNAGRESVQKDGSEKQDRQQWISNQLSGQRFYVKIKNKVSHLLIKEDRYQTLKLVCIVIFVSFFLKNISQYLHKLLFFYAQLKIVTQLRNQLQEKIMRLPLSFFHKRHTASLTSIVFNDVSGIQMVLDSSFVKIFLAPMQILSYLVVLLMISWKLTVATFLLLPLSGYLLVKIGQSMRRKSRRVYEQISMVVTAFQESVSSIRVVKSFTAELREIAKFARTNQDYFAKSLRAKKLDALTGPLNETIGVLIFTALLWYGGTMVYRGEGLNAEDFIRFLVFLFMIFQPLKELSGLNNVLQTGLAAAERIFNFLDQPTEPYNAPQAVPLGSFERDIVFEHVWFSYNGQTPVLKDINLTIRKGEMVALVGHSGVGKSTLADLIPRFYDVTAGSLKIDGRDVREYDLTSLRDHIGIVSQETLLFNDTVRYNIGYGLSEYTEEEVIAAAKAANAWEFISKMEQGLDTLIGERGVTLSGGQKQRISIARAILKNTPILILDEATSSLDTQSEKLVQAAIDNLMKNRTVLAIAHRLSTVIHADKIVVMEDGRIADVGKHHELLKRSPLYQELYRMQFHDQ
ncbi:MAG: ABC transporter ATP-binding protein/permease [candidate division KSB1 bacterium]|nr:ABC transporter ATP-binding protein/permease [candidate division KSB1 bacterium]